MNNNNSISELPHFNFLVSAHAFSQLYKNNIKKLNGILRIMNHDYEVEIMLRGSSTKNNPKRSYEVNFTDELYQGKKTMHFNAEFWDYSLLRNKLSFDFFKTLNVLSPTAQHILLYVNNDYQGVYTLLESVDETFLNRNNRPLGDIYYAVDSNANLSLWEKYNDKYKTNLIKGYKRKYQYSNGDKKLHELITNINNLSEDKFQEIKKQIDIDNFIGWLLGAVLTSNYDGFNKNYALYYNPQSGKFEISPWDYDGTWGRNWCGKILKYNRVPINGHNVLTIKAVNNKYIRRIYFKRMIEVFEKEFNLYKVRSKLEDLYNSIRKFVYKDMYKRSTNNEFEEEYDLIIDYVKNRSNYLFKKMKDY